MKMDFTYNDHVLRVIKPYNALLASL